MYGPVPVLDLIAHVLEVGITPSECNQWFEQQLKRLLELESLSITDVECTMHEQFTQIIEFQDGYELHLPWKDPTISIPDNYQLT